MFERREMWVKMTLGLRRGFYQIIKKFFTRKLNEMFWVRYPSNGYPEINMSTTDPFSIRLKTLLKRNPYLLLLETLILNRSRKKRVKTGGLLEMCRSLVSLRSRVTTYLGEVFLNPGWKRDFGRKRETVKLKSRTDRSYFWSQI